MVNIFSKLSGVSNVKYKNQDFILTETGDLYYIKNSKQLVLIEAEKPISSCGFLERGLLVQHNDGTLELIDRSFDPNALPYDAVVSDFVVNQYFNSSGGYAEISFINPMDENWLFTEIRRKLGSYPQDRDDGEFVVKIYTPGLVRIIDDTPLFFDINAEPKYFYTAFPVNREFVASIGKVENQGINTYTEIGLEFEKYEIDITNNGEESIIKVGVVLEFQDVTPVSDKFDAYEIDIVNTEEKKSYVKVTLEF